MQLSDYTRMAQTSMGILTHWQWAHSCGCKTGIQRPFLLRPEAVVVAEMGADTDVLALTPTTDEDKRVTAMAQASQPFLPFLHARVMTLSAVTIHRSEIQYSRTHPSAQTQRERTFRKRWVESSKLLCKLNFLRSPLSSSSVCGGLGAEAKAKM